MHGGSRFGTPIIFFFSIMLLFPIPNVVSDQDHEEHGSITAADDMHTPRYNHTATLLGNGMILVAGGTSNGELSLDSCEIFDPDTGTWSITGDLSRSRMRHGASSLPSGSVLISGGYMGVAGAHPSLLEHFSASSARSLASCEIFDPSQGDFRNTSPMSVGRFWHASVALPDGRVMAIGGLNVSDGALSSCEVFDPQSGSWKTAASMNTPRARFSTTVLDDGRILVSGGHDGMDKSPMKGCELYEPEQNRWIAASDMIRPRGYSAAVRMEDGRVMVSGGFSGEGTPDWDDAEIYDPPKDSWELTSKMSFPRHNHEMFIIPGGEVMVAGGSNCQSGMCHSGLEYYDPESDTWHESNLVVLGRKWTTSVVLANGSAVISGGKTCNTPTGKTEIYHPPEPPGVNGPRCATDDSPISTVIVVLSSLALVLLLGSLVARKYPEKINTHRQGAPGKGQQKGGGDDPFRKKGRNRS